MITRLITITGLISALLAAGWVLWRPLATKQTTIRLPGTVEIHEVRLGSKVGGRVKSVCVGEGDLVKAGQVLVELDIPELLAQRDQLQAQIRGADAELQKWKEGPRMEEKLAARATVRAAAARRKLLEEGPRAEEIEEARGEMEAVAAQLEHARLNLERELALSISKTSTAAAVDEAKALHGKLSGQMRAATAHLRLLEAGTRPEELQQAQAELARAQANSDLLDAGSRPQDIDEAGARVAELKARLRELNSQIDEAVVKSPSSAVVEVVVVRPGEIVEQSQAVIRVLEPEQLWVKAYVSEIELGKVRLNQEVAVSVDAYPQKRFTGTVTFIANDSEFTPRNVQTINERRNQVFAIKVRVQDPEKVFKSGMAADVWVNVN